MKSRSLPAAIVLSMTAVFVLAGCATKTIDAVAEHRWTELRSDNFIMMTDAGAVRGRQFLANLEEFRAYIARIHPASISPNASPVRVIAFADGKSFRTVIKNPHISGGFKQTYRGDYAIADLSLRLADGRLTLSSSRARAIVPIYVYAARNLLQHEYIEYVLAARRGLRYPLWFREGYAEYMSTFRIINNKTALIGEVPRYRLTSIRSQDWMPLKTLLAARSYETGYNIELLYSQSWLVVHYMMSDPERSKALQQYLAMVYEGISEETAFRVAFEVTEEELYKALRLYARREKFPYQKVNVGQQTPPQVSEREIPEDEVKFHLGYLKLTFAGDPATSSHLLEESLAANPDHSAARAELARLYMLKERHEDAQQLLDVGLVRGPADADLLTIQGHLFIVRAVREYGEGKAGWYEWLQKARRNFREAFESDPRYAEAYVALGQSYIADKVVPPEAFSALQTAAELQPSNIDILFILARLHLNNDDLDRAYLLFEEVMTWSHNPEYIARSRTFLEEIEEREKRALVRDVLDTTSQIRNDLSLKPGVLLKP